MLDGSRGGTGLGGLGKGEGCWKDARPDAKIAGEMPAGGAAARRAGAGWSTARRALWVVRGSQGADAKIAGEMPAGAALLEREVAVSSHDSATFLACWRGTTDLLEREEI